jgi:hypothetical protein
MQENRKRVLEKKYEENITLSLCIKKILYFRLMRKKEKKYQKIKKKQMLIKISFTFSIIL